MAEIELEIPARPDYLALVRSVISAAVAAESTRTDTRLDDLRLAVTEACANAIEATGAHFRDEPVRIRCSFDDERIVIEIVDRGGGFDPSALDTLPTATDPGRLDHERGLGIELMRTFADDVTFEPSPDGTAGS